MRSLFYVLSALAVIGLAYWAYHENYQTQASIGHAESLESDIAQARQRLRVLNAEWAYQNRPDRLRQLADMNFDRLQLAPIQVDQFSPIDQVPLPPTQVEFDLTGAIDLSSDDEQLP
ncbi:cell division protein FtsL [Roseovarius aestuarii]|nr:cell division protein FtsL [Roseovarius aestuarii]